MNLAATIQIHGGGPGSGCHGEHCGRPRNEAFEELASKQRGKPESAMVRIGNTIGTGLYSHTAEHVGDLTHRMSEKYDFLKGQFGTVKEKVDKTLSALKEAYGFEKEMNEQLRDNYSYYKERGYPVGTFAQEEQKLKDYGEAYAAAHEKLPVHNEVQRLARDAAVAVGRMNFDVAREKLQSLDDILKKGRENWEKVSGEYDG